MKGELKQWLTIVTGCRTILVMINELFDNHIVTFNISNYWDNAKIEVFEIWPCHGTSVDIDIKERFEINYE